MIVRIKGVVEKINIVEGTKNDRPWSRKVYTIRDNSYRDPQWNKCVEVSDFGKLDKDSYEPVFVYHSNHVVDEEVDLACYLSTTDGGFTHVDYGMPYEDIEKPKTTGNVIRPDAQPTHVEEEPVAAQEEDPEAGPFGSIDAGSTLPF